MRTLVIGDIHGSCRALEQLLNRAPISPDDTLIFLGDYVDGWGQSPEVIEFLIKLNTTHRCIFMRGNHDALLMSWLKNGDKGEQWFNNGGRITTESYNKLEQDIKQVHIAFLENLKDYHVDAQNRLFVHAGFTNLSGAEHEFFKRLLYWERTLWETALALDKTIATDHPFYPKRFTLYKEIYIGHTPVTRIGKTTPVQMANVWNVDTGAAFKGPITLLDVDTKEFWQSDPVYMLHPEENGRN